MNNRVFKRGIGELSLVFGIGIDDARTQVYWEHLKDLSNEDFVKAIKVIIENNKFFPAISEIRQVVESNDKDVVDAWNEFQEQDYDFDDPQIPQYKNKILNECLRFLGGVRAIADTPRREKKFLRKDFIDVYKILRQRQKFLQIKLPERKVEQIAK